MRLRFAFFGVATAASLELFPSFAVSPNPKDVRSEERFFALPMGLTTALSVSTEGLLRRCLIGRPGGIRCWCFLPKSELLAIATKCH